jgi:hypothetical protein
VGVAELISTESIEALRQQPIAVTEKGFGAIASGRAVSPAWLAEQRPPLFGGDFMMPLLVLRDSALRNNAAAMADWCAARGLRLAPHGKTTMAPQLFARQIESGAWGITAATLAQAQVYRSFGVGRILIANELTDAAGIGWPVSCRPILTGNASPTSTAWPGFGCWTLLWRPPEPVGH